jgi:hypothetical protein
VRRRGVPLLAKESGERLKSVAAAVVEKDKWNDCQPSRPLAIAKDRRLDAIIVKLAVLQRLQAVKWLLDIVESCQECPAVSVDISSHQQPSTNPTRHRVRVMSIQLMGNGI